MVTFPYKGLGTNLGADSGNDLANLSAGRRGLSKAGRIKKQNKKTNPPSWPAALRFLSPDWWKIIEI